MGLERLNITIHGSEKKRNYPEIKNVQNGDSINYRYVVI